MELKQLAGIIRQAAKDGADKALAGAPPPAKMLRKSAAYKAYGRSNVDRWIAEGLIKISNKTIDMVTLERIAASSNRSTYLPVAER